MPQLISLSKLIQESGVPKPLAKLLVPPFGWFTGLSRINKLYDRFHFVLDDLEDDPLFFSKALHTIRVQFEGAVDVQGTEQLGLGLSQTTPLAVSMA